MPENYLKTESIQFLDIKFGNYFWKFNLIIK